MDTLDKVMIMPTTPIKEAPEHGSEERDLNAEAHDAADELELELEDEIKSVNWWKIAAYTAAGLAVVGAAGGYVYWRAQQKKPQTRLERLKGDLGLRNVDFTSLPTSLRDIDFARLEQSRRRLGTYARKATHAGAKKVAELTR